MEDARTVVRRTLICHGSGAGGMGLSTGTEFGTMIHGTANAPGAGLELHMNNVAVGPKVPSPTLEYPQARETHFTLEPSLGLFPW